MRLTRLVVPIVALLILAACGSSSGSDAVSGHKVSKQALMVCQPEAVNDMAGALATKTVGKPEQGWSDGDFTCTYKYPAGASMLLSVRDLGSDSGTSSYLAELRKKLGKSPSPISFGTQGAFITPSGNVVVQKDSHVLIVDVSKMPSSFSNPPLDHVSAAEIAASTIMSCWKGDS